MHTLSPFSQALLNWLQAHVPGTRYWVAYSGGLDSHALLHVLVSAQSELPAGVGAVHVNHNLHPRASRWQRHCQQVCERWQIPCRTFGVDARPQPGESPEAAARAARYTALRDWLADGECLLTAHHQDDQAETLLLQLLRGSGPRGLSGIHTLAAFGNGWLARPLLLFSQDDIRTYAAAQKLQWIEDPGNTDQRFDRNFLRSRIMPLLAQRWPAMPRTLTRAARLQTDAAVLQEALGRIDLDAVCLEKRHGLSVSRLYGLSAARQRNLMRYWLETRSVPAPSEAVMERICGDVLRADPDRVPLVRWEGGEVRRYRDVLYAFPPLPLHDHRQRLEWIHSDAVELPGAGGVLRRRDASGRGIRAALAADGLQIRFRQGGEAVRRAGHPHHHALKKLFQERGIPPWERARVPLIYCADELLAVAGLWVCDGYQAAPGEAGIEFFWSRLDALDMTEEQGPA